MNTTTKPGVLEVLDHATGNLLRSRNQAITNSAAAVREARATVERLAEAARHAAVVLGALGGPTAAERDEAIARVKSELAAFRGEP